MPARRRPPTKKTTALADRRIEFETATEAELDAHLRARLDELARDRESWHDPHQGAA